MSLKRQGPGGQARSYATSLNYDVTSNCTASAEALVRVHALAVILNAAAAGRIPADPALVTSCASLAGRAAVWASVVAEHGEVA